MLGHPPRGIGVRLQFGEKVPKSTVKIKSRGLADSWAQMVLLGLNILKRIVLKKRELLKVGAELRVANGGVTVSWWFVTEVIYS